MQNCEGICNLFKSVYSFTFSAFSPISKFHLFIDDEKVPILRTYLLLILVEWIQWHGDFEMQPNSLRCTISHGFYSYAYFILIIMLTLYSVNVICRMVLWPSSSANVTLVLTQKLVNS